ncbi:RNA polymerase sigma-70 factor [Pedobacter sp.]|jgi:RNA polymerase sigma-70 factor (family 1)|uniref:RNA polymerase sigma factor n=1 Tax=Pedobacter sp. TaxID=1411316 RepID=UPI002CDBE963|nr:RNA polymerase sigma-70 factor [Pedobacter sp.]HWW38716.1 RNA polymerase sigma-70 factor [Pedobacter sp.]
MRIYNELSDQELIELLKIKDQGAFAEIYSRFWNKLMAIAYNHTKDKSAAQEIVQELFIGLWNRRDQLEILNIGNYLATAIKFSIYKQIDKEKRRREVENNGTGFYNYSEDEEKIEAKFLQEYINGLVEQLPEKCRLVFNYSRVQGLSIPEIAEEMNISEKTVEGHLTKGLKTIKSNLKDSGILSLLVTEAIHEFLK